MVLHVLRRVCRLSSPGLRGAVEAHVLGEEALVELQLGVEHGGHGDLGVGVEHGVGQLLGHELGHLLLQVVGGERDPVGRGHGGVFRLRRGQEVLRHFGRNGGGDLKVLPSFGGVSESLQRRQPRGDAGVGPGRRAPDGRRGVLPGQRGRGRAEGGGPGRGAEQGATAVDGAAGAERHRYGGVGVCGRGAAATPGGEPARPPGVLQVPQGQDVMRFGSRSR